MTETTESAATVNRRAYLEKTVYLVAPTLGTWAGVYHLPRADTETKVQGESVKKSDITTPQAKLITNEYPLDQEGKPWKKRLDMLHTQLEKSKSKFSVRFSINGIRIVPKAKIGDFLKELYGDTLGDLKTQKRVAEDAGKYQVANVLNRRISAFAADTPDSDPVADAHGNNSIFYNVFRIRQEFVASWEDIVKQIASKSSVYDRIKTKVPDAKAIGNKFYLDVTPIELSGGGGRETNMEDFLANQRNVQEACQRRVDEAITEILEGPRNELTEAMQALEELMARGGVVSDRSFNAVRLAIDKMKMFDFSLTPELVGRVKRVESVIGNATPKSLNRDSGISSVFQKELANIREAINTDKAVEEAYRQFGSAPRLLDI